MQSPFYLDAFMLACPDSSSDINSFLTYIENIISWNELRKYEWAKFFISQSASIALVESKSYPLFDIIKKNIAQFNITHIQAKDVSEIVTSFLTKACLIEEELGIKELLIENFNINPDPGIDRRIKPFPEHFQLLSILILLHCNYIPEILNQILITSNNIQYTGIINITATIPVLDKISSDVIPDSVSEPLSISGEFHICKCMHTLHLSLDPYYIWANANCNSALIKAIELFVYQEQPRQGPYNNPIEHCNFMIGSKFFESCKHLNFNTDSRKIKMLLRTCSEVIFNKNTSDTHWLRVDRGANSAQKTRGNDRAWRRDIDHEYHLHYWQTDNGPELASVVQHNDFTIPI
jgi:hypothetical protein